MSVFENCYISVAGSWTWLECRGSSWRLCWKWVKKRIVYLLHIKSMSSDVGPHFFVQKSTQENSIPLAASFGFLYCLVTNCRTVVCILMQFIMLRYTQKTTGRAHNVVVVWSNDDTPDSSVCVCVCFVVTARWYSALCMCQGQHDCYYPWDSRVKDVIYKCIYDYDCFNDMTVSVLLCMLLINDSTG